MVSVEEVLQLQKAVGEVFISDAMKGYIVDIVQRTRSHEGVKLGASPRASLGLKKVAQALALMDGQDFVTPDHVQEVASPVIAHRLVLEPQLKYAGLSASNVVAEILEQLVIPQ